MPWGLDAVPALDRPDLLAESVAKALQAWPDASSAQVVEIDPEVADTAAMSQTYGVPLESGFNCVVISGRRDGEERVAACVVRSDTRADVNGVAKRLLDVRKASFLSRERAVSESGMEYGGITPIGLPAAWRVLVDSRILDAGPVVLGSGVRRSKLLLPGPALAAAPRVEVIEGLGG
ncbi:YbaK/EbsC family protein [Nocardioides sp. R-C-SC26]|uniref:YbaK/EbsC family protein n=1 Tax=Nocardioides sp. R-C-SC26 TaxID=2870414 RepID=UPI001E379E8B|nr:YbaK/EbsC family protein [Nocardioides sp. R-C-SC26]